MTISAFPPGRRRRPLWLPARRAYSSERPEATFPGPDRLEGDHTLHHIDTINLNESSLNQLSRTLQGVGSSSRRPGRADFRIQIPLSYVSAFHIPPSAFNSLFAIFPPSTFRLPHSIPSVPRRKNKFALMEHMSHFQRMRWNALPNPSSALFQG
jgi:hypothetical protein